MGIGDDPGVGPYTWQDYVLALFAGPQPHISRPVDHGTDGLASHCHKGFNWGEIRHESVQRWQLLRTYGSPAPCLRLDFNSQVWFNLRKPWDGERCLTTSPS